MNSNQPRDYGQTYRTTNPDRTKIYDYMFFSFTEMRVLRLIHGVKRRERLRNVKRMLNGYKSKQDRLGDRERDG